MPARIVIGRHSRLGVDTMGLFISKPGIDAKSADLAVPANWLFNSQWSQTCNIIAAGVTTTDAWIPAITDPGTKPMLFWRRLNGSLNGEVISESGYDHYDGTRDYYFQQYYSTFDQVNKQFIVRFYNGSGDPVVAYNPIRFIVVQL